MSAETVPFTSGYVRGLLAASPRIVTRAGGGELPITDYWRNVVEACCAEIDRLSASEPVPVVPEGPQPGGEAT